MFPFAEILINWYQQYKRNLPWRNTRNPYLIWISEIILQQTRVSQGLDYYRRFVARFPSPAALAAATEDEVLKAWQGLGYYSRARNMHAAAKSMKGVFPATYPEVLALKGVGPYTAAAICSFAYGMPYAVVDGNVYRVLARVFGLKASIDTASGKKTFLNLAQELLDKKRPDLFNQAIMDFGALQCTPANPACTVCPFNTYCIAYKKHLIPQLPCRTAKPKVTSRLFYYLYVEQEGKIWLHKRPAGDIWQGLYEPPLLQRGASARLSLEQVTALFAKQGVCFPPHTTPVLAAGPVKHVLTHQVIYAYLYKVNVPPSCPLPSGQIAVCKEDIKEYPLSRLVVKLWEQAGLL